MWKLVEWVSKDIAKAFPKGMHGHKTPENNVVGLPGYQVIFQGKGGAFRSYVNKIKTSFNPLPKKIA